MFLSRTGSKRGKKYFPSSMTVGGKTGTYKGATRLEGRSIQSRSNHHTMIFQHEGKSYSLSVLSDPGNDETVAILSGGIIRDYLGVDGGLAKPCD
jgi:3-deoxy-D-arabino-heptulosonate 7-phosphate (DAHP) synthase